VQTYLLVDAKSKYQWGIYLGLPVLYSITCDKKGKYRAIDGSLAYSSCYLARKNNGNSNPIRWISNSYYQLKKILDQRNCQELAISNCNDIKNFLHYPKDRFTAQGLVLYNENRKMHEYVKEYTILSKTINNKKEIVMEDTADSVDSFFGKAADLYKKNKDFRNNVVTCLLRAMVVKQTSGTLNVKKEQKVFDFFRYL